MTQIFLLPLLISCAFAFLITPLVISLAWKFGLVDDPKKHKHPKVIHKNPTPRGGGLAIWAAIVLASLLFLPKDIHLISILLGITILVIMGLVDDKYDLSPYPRLVVQVFASLLPISAGITTSFITNPLGSGVIASPSILISVGFTLLWYLVLINFLNMGAKGVPGQLSGVATIAALTIAILSLRFSADITEWPVIILAAITAGAFLGHLPWNIFPQKIMPSFSGSNIAGFMLATLSIISTTKIGTLMLVLAVPLIDTGYTIARRVASGKPPFWGDRGHLHHKLLDMGFSQTQVAVMYWGVTALLGILALHLNAASKLYTIIGVTIFTGGLLLWLTYKHKQKL